MKKEKILSYLWTRRRPKGCTRLMNQRGLGMTMIMIITVIGVRVVGAATAAAVSIYKLVHINILFT